MDWPPSVERPEFFIVGAPRCATSFLNHYLPKHPDIFMAPWELHFFGSDLEFAKGRISLEEYASYFRPAKPTQMVGERSALYLYSSRAAEEIKAFCPSAKIIIMLRNPLDMLWSLHGMMVRRMEEDVLDLESAIEAGGDRARGERLPELPGNAMFPVVRRYAQMARFTPHVTRFFEAFPREQVKVFLYDDVEKQPEAVISRAFEFLGVAPWTPPRLDVINKGYGLRSSRLKRVLERPPRWISAAAKVTTLPQTRHQLYRAFTKLNRGPRKEPRMPGEVRRKLGPRFEADVLQLQELISMDLSSWIASWRV